MSHPPVSSGSSSQAKAPRPRLKHVQAFLDMAGPSAREVAKKWKVPASVLLAQAALESGWGQHVKGNAYFGIKGKKGTTGGVTFGTTEFVDGKQVSINDTFRGYNNFAEAAEDYGKFLSENARYQVALLHTNDPMRFVDEIARAGYATDPLYAQKLKGTIRSQRLTEYDQ
jgi:flagellum-specific peptidoglycan hydrolase FlgJ